MNARISQPRSALDKLLERSLSYANSGNLAEAVRLCHKILDVRPGHFNTLIFIGKVLVRQKKYDGAVEFLSRALTISPRSFDACFTLGLAFQLAGQWQKAVDYYKEAIIIEPKNADSYYNVGLVFSEQRNFGDAEKCLKRALSLSPKNVLALTAMAGVFFSQGRFEEAETFYKKALVLQPDHFDALTNLGVISQHKRRFDEAMDFYKRAVQAKPDYPPALNNIGTVFQIRGHLKEANGVFSRLLSIEPDFVKTYACYVVSKEISPDDAALMERMEQFLGRADLNEEQKIDLHFALGKCYDDLKQYDRAFEHFAAGNFLENKKCRFDLALYSREIAEIISIFQKDFFSQRGDFGDSSEMPIFIIGMPRSGTSLVEQILSSHAGVFGAGELDFWERQRARTPFNWVGQAKKQDIVSIGAEYMSYLRTFSPDATHVVDKMPQNFFLLGMIHLCFPKARIVHCVRNPLDTCLSIYFQKFTTDHPYAYDLGNLVRYYEGYASLMAHWKAVFPEKILDVSYERLVENQESETRKILEFCGLEWDERCLSFYETERAVLTASNWQVRQPLYSHSVSRWKNYGNFLGPLERLAS